VKEIPLTRGMVALVDDEDYDLVSRFKWHATRSGRNYYARHRYLVCHRKGPNVQLWIHRLIIKARRWQVVDHINGDTLDNRRCNLRICTATQNTKNRKPSSNNTSGFKGVTFHKRMNRYQSYITADKKLIHLGTFPDPISAARAYDAAARRLHGEFARLNFPDQESAA
jgi:hypothetical protein